MAVMKWMGMILPEGDGEDGMNGKDDWIVCYVWMNVPEVDGSNGMNGMNEWKEAIIIHA